VCRRKISFDAIYLIGEDETKKKKKLKSVRSELVALMQLLDQIALAHPTVSLEVWDEKCPFPNYPQIHGKISCEASQKCYGEIHALQRLLAFRWTVTDIP
jgi:DNA mismatch repair ATPase MutL